MFNKRMITKINVNSLTSGMNYALPIPGFRNVAGGALIFINTPDNNVNFNSLGQNFWHQWRYGINNVFITDSTGRNVLNNNKFDADYSRFLMGAHFGNLITPINQNCNTKINFGELFWTPFTSDGSDSWNGVHNGGYSFAGSSDHILNFTSLSTVSACILNLIWFVPSIIELNNVTMALRVRELSSENKNYLYR